LQRVTASPELRQKERLGWVDKLLSMRRDSLNNGTDKEGTGEGEQNGKEERKSLLFAPPSHCQQNKFQPFKCYPSLSVTDSFSAYPKFQLHKISQILLTSGLSAFDCIFPHFKISLCKV
jgi:hypothetical protein